MKQLFQDMGILFVWIILLFLFSWSLIWFTQGIRNSLLISFINRELKNQAGTDLLLEPTVETINSLLFTVEKGKPVALLSTISTSYGVSANITFTDQSGNPNTVYPLSVHSKVLNQRTSGEVMDFFLNVWLSNSLLAEKGKGR